MGEQLIARLLAGLWDHEVSIDDVLAELLEQYAVAVVYENDGGAHMAVAVARAKSREDAIEMAKAHYGDGIRKVIVTRVIPE